MRRVDVDFRRRSEPARWMWWLSMVLWLVALALGAFAWDAHRQNDRLRAAIEAARTRPAEPKPSTPAVPPPYEESARRLLAEHDSTWPSALRALEQVNVEGVQVVAFDISTSEQRARIEVRYSSYKRLLQYVRELNLGEPQPRWEVVQTTQPDAEPGSTAHLVGSLRP